MDILIQGKVWFIMPSDGGPMFREDPNHMQLFLLQVLKT